MREVSVYLGDALRRYGFPDGHPFGGDRLASFWDEAQRRGLAQLVEPRDPVQASEGDLELFHTSGHIERVKQLSVVGHGFLDYGDTPAFPGCYEAAATVVGSVLDALAEIVEGRVARAFVPIAGLHHARRDRAAGFCIFNDCGVAIEAARQRYGISRVAYVDIDAHHGDGVFYGFEADPELFIADIHEDGRFLYPGTGGIDESGQGLAAGTKLNLPLLPKTGDAEFERAWSAAEAFLEQARPELVIMQCGADGLAGDPLTHLELSSKSHVLATRSLMRLARRYAGGRLLLTGGGGYNHANLAAGWNAALSTLLGVDVE